MSNTYSEPGKDIPQKFSGPKTSIFYRDFGQLCEMIANISRLE